MSMKFRQILVPLCLIFSFLYSLDLVLAESGDIKIKTARSTHIALLDAQDATSTFDGVWVKTFGLKNISVHIKGIAGGAVIKIHSSNSTARPAAATHDIERTNLSADGEATYAVAPRWMKTRISTSGTGTIDAMLVGNIAR